MTSTQTKKDIFLKFLLEKCPQSTKLLNWFLDANPHYHVLCCTIRCKFAVLGTSDMLQPLDFTDFNSLLYSS